MPMVNGFDVLRSVRQTDADQGRGTVVIALTAHASEDPCGRPRSPCITKVIVGDWHEAGLSLSTASENVAEAPDALRDLVRVHRRIPEHEANRAGAVQGLCAGDLPSARALRPPDRSGVESFRSRNPSRSKGQRSSISTMGEPGTRLALGVRRCVAPPPRRAHRASWLDRRTRSRRSARGGAANLRIGVPHGGERLIVSAAQARDAS